MKIFKEIFITPLSIIGILLVLVSCKTEKSNVMASNKTKRDTLSITVLQTADIHGQLDTHPELFWEDENVVFKTRGGLANIKTLFARERQKNPNRTIIVDGGDLIQGSGYTALSEGKVMPELIKNMGYDVIIPGNWEVVYGKDVMIDVMQGYDTDVIAQNMYHEKSEELLFPAYSVKEIEGVRVGFMGINDPDVPVRQNPIFSKGIAFSSLTNELKKQVDDLKANEDLDVLFLVTHLGVFKQVELANNTISESVDYILGNDTHERVRKPIQGKFAKVTEPGAFGSFVGKLTLHFVDGTLVSDEYELIDVDPKVFPADTKVQALVDKAKAPYEEHLETVIGYTKTPIYRYLTVENPMDNMITDAARWKTGADISISNGFRFGNPIVPKNGKPAPITRANLWNLLPVNEKVKTGKATGNQIKEWLEKEMHNAFSQKPTERFGGWLVRFSGMKVNFNSQNERGNRITAITVNGEPMEDDEFYTISACVRPGDPIDNLCRMANVKDVEVMDYTIHEVVEEYLKKKSPVSPTIDGRAYCDYLGTYSFSTVPKTNYKFQ
ncbi:MULTISPECIES: bifunctional metallophosphatase/5'-nucleotidase [Croceibacter]|jgi:sulfur-oxidizing protein SoxB|uniref:5'-nucleotidase n=1 Tax=Croceibacter atlanticus (strain ATCC BAA-628 / JCM 21780 / CIP 108009 / IAM 15332 / KCTC 12090 / HTCC2559) TaxID=216432 RepID=A3UA83_CROAH|nr:MULTISPECIES: bifunctional metallophosphatase/5'-nucleotidase [Croceibacter]EAP86719.1 5'-nucleotidase [Croceibacter atlanticus HTCC2559]MAO26034.1 bifunctional metallophosphatase/5'-nucleotidase [Roseovarius sp.]MBG25110.1 bifunctional metallophosphatase/5'-nucleotidase [Croceibacter sp.]MBW4970845.1 bifunctional metallophosphatase/5'-nucleotidase [Croceibacter atlanticus]